MLILGVLLLPYCQFKSLWIGVKRIAYCVVAWLPIVQTRDPENQHGFYFAYIRICTVFDSNIYLYVKSVRATMYLF